MIHTVILGADSPDAGELIRILAMHPEIEIECAQAHGMEGKPLTSHHHGLIGETSATFSMSPSCKKCDVVLDFSPAGEPALTEMLAAKFPDVKIIRMNRCATDATNDGNDGDDGDEWVYALPEINRKALVRGARKATLPSPFASMALVGLYPLALNMLLKDDITLHFEAPQSIIDTTDLKAVAEEIETALRKAQMSFEGKVLIDAVESSTRRSGIMSLDMSCPINMEHLRNIYEMYDDHHFAFAVSGQVGASEVAGTDKCVISLSKPDSDILHLGAVADCRMRGGAGEAVHVLNLMFGLHERTGLALKAIDFHPI